LVQSPLTNFFKIQAVLVCLHLTIYALGTSVCRIPNKKNEILKKMALAGAGTLFIIILELVIYSALV
jgi:hypothetical protein